MATAKLIRARQTMGGTTMEFEVVADAWDRTTATLMQRVFVPSDAIIATAKLAPPQEPDERRKWLKAERDTLLATAKRDCLARAEALAIRLAEARVGVEERDRRVAEIDADIERLQAARKRILAGEIEGAVAVTTEVADGR